MYTLLFKELKSRWLEYLLGAGMIALVVSVLVAQRAVTSAAGSKIHDLAHKLGKNMLVLPATTDLPGFYTYKFGKDSLPEDYSDRVFKSPLRKHISMIESLLYGNIEAGGVPVVLVGSDLRRRGRKRPAPKATNTARLTSASAQRLNLKIGNSIELSDHKMRVASIKADRLNGPEMAVYTSLGTAQKSLHRPQEINAMRMGGCWCKVDIPTLASDVEKELPGTRAITASKVVKAQKETIRTMSRYSGIINIAGTGMVGGTVFALTLSRVRRRRREIGLLLAVGAPPWKINSMFVLRAGLTGLIGGALGYLLGIPVTAKLASSALDATLAPSPEQLPGILIMCLVTSVVFAYLPSWQATSLDPTVVLREE